ncbi:heme-dependent oxidative N-demethylase family protein [Coleofasciculus chthonoplastes]|uniref:heme-dependent oxidative N-demethylase family protein n=1 Tax=Coleofasciculus chthonoplastes TaxID=64178 RepID=UPI00406472E4
MGIPRYIALAISGGSMSMLDHLLKHFPQHYRRHSQTIDAIATHQVWHIPDFESAPLDLAGRLVQEDLLLMERSRQGYRLVAASLCFPLRWRLREKLGCPLTQIHAPVPGYSEKLAHPVDSVFNRLKSSHPVWRLNWSIVESPELFFPPENAKPGWETTINCQNAGDKLFLRMERQTLRRLATSGDILFTVRTYVHPLRVLEDNPQMAHNLMETIQQMPLEMQNYKNLLPIQEVLLGYLEYIASFKHL